MVQGSQYWDMFEERIVETVDALNNNTFPPLRRVSLHITNRCNLSCSYCNECHTPKSLPYGSFMNLVDDYRMMGGGILHITGGEPSCVEWLFEAIKQFNSQSKYDCVQFHVNTNLIADIDYATLQSVKRLKVSLDSYDAEYFDDLVGIKGSFMKVYDNLKKVNAMPDEDRPIVSITYTMTHENYKHIPKFLEMYYQEFPNLYAVFFSTYKGTNDRFSFTEDDITDIFDNIKPQIDEIFEKYGDSESKFLFNASHDRTTFADSIRFEDNKTVPCYLQLSELVVNEDGDISNCSHLYRDGVGQSNLNLKNKTLGELFKKSKAECGLKVMHEKCLYGCNKKLVTFNKQVEGELNAKI